MFDIIEKIVLDNSLSEEQQVDRLSQEFRAGRIRPQEFLKNDKPNVIKLAYDLISRRMSLIVDFFFDHGIDLLEIMKDHSDDDKYRQHWSNYFNPYQKRLIHVLCSESPDLSRLKKLIENYKVSFEQPYIDENGNVWLPITLALYYGHFELATYLRSHYEKLGKNALPDDLQCITFPGQLESQHNEKDREKLTSFLNDVGFYERRGLAKPQLPATQAENMAGLKKGIIPHKYNIKNRGIINALARGEPVDLQLSYTYGVDFTFTPQGQDSLLLVAITSRNIAAVNFIIEKYRRSSKLAYIEQNIHVLKGAAKGNTKIILLLQNALNVGQNNVASIFHGIERLQREPGNPEHFAMVKLLIEADPDYLNYHQDGLYIIASLARIGLLGVFAESIFKKKDPIYTEICDYEKFIRTCFPVQAEKTNSMPLPSVSWSDLQKLAHTGAENLTDRIIARLNGNENSVVNKVSKVSKVSMPTARVAAAASSSSSSAPASSSSSSMSGAAASSSSSVAAMVIDEQKEEPASVIRGITPSPGLENVPVRPAMDIKMVDILLKHGSQIFSQTEKPKRDTQRHTGKRSTSTRETDKSSRANKNIKDERGNRVAARSKAPVSKKVPLAERAQNQFVLR